MRACHPETVPIERLLPHPANANVMPPGALAKLERNIRAGGAYPPVVARALEASEKWGHAKGYNPADRQILDGHHRVKVLRGMGVKEVRCDVWRGVDDQAALRYLATLNALRGKDDVRKRASLLDLLIKGAEGDVDAVAEFVPETVQQITFREEVVRPAVPAEDEEEAGDPFDTWFVLVPDEMRRVIAAAVRLRLNKGELPGQGLDRTRHAAVMGDYNRGRALYDICSEYILRNTTPEAQ